MAVPQPLKRGQERLHGCSRHQQKPYRVDIVNDLQHEGMEIKAETTVDIVTRFNRKAVERVLGGYNVNTGLVYMRPVIKGALTVSTHQPDGQL